MSRPSVFRRIASWLKNTSELQEKCRQREAVQRIQRRYSVQALEDRQMLDAAFFFDAVNDRLTLDSFTEVVDETLTITETADDYRFVLSEGVWTGADFPLEGVVGAGTNDLRVAKVPIPGPFGLNEVIVNDALGIDMIVDNVNFTGISPVTDFTINTNRGSIQQTALTTASFVNLTVNGADLVELRETSNSFGLISIVNTNDVSIREASVMNLGLIQINNDAEFENNGLMVLERPFTIGGDVLLNSNDGDIFQRRVAGIFVGGETFLKSNITDEFGIDFGFGDRNGDGLNDNDFVGAVNVLQGAQIEIVDSNSLIIGDVTTHGNNIREVFQFYAEAEAGSITVDGVINVPGVGEAHGKVILRATNGATETPLGRIIADDIVLIGDGDFVFGEANEIFDNDTVRPGIIAADVNGNLLFNNERDLQVGSVTFEFIADRDLGGGALPPVVVNVNALDIRKTAGGSGGNLTITTSDDNLTQNGSAPVIVEELTTIDVGSGNVTWEFGDELGDLLNDNNWNRLMVLSANNASFIDVNSITVEDVDVLNNARFQAENDNPLVLDGQIIVGNNLLFQSDIGLTQAGGFVQAGGLAVQGQGNFIFDLSNRIGDATTSGRVAADLRSGEFAVDNLFGLQVTTIGAFGETIIGIDGFQLDKTRLNAAAIEINQTVNVVDLLLESNSTVSQTSAITAETMIVRSNSGVNLSTPNSVEIIAAEVEGGFDYNSAIEFSIGNLTYDATNVAGVSVADGPVNDFNITTNNLDVHQFADAPVVVDGTLTIGIGTGCLAFAFGDGNGDTFNDNDFNIVVVNSAERVELVDRNNITTNAINVSDQIRIKSDTGTIHLEGDLIATNKVLLQAGNGVQQNPDAGGNEGVVDTAALMLQGDGAFILDHLNQVGDATTPGEIAVEINGAFELNNEFDLASKTLTFELKDGSTVTINGFIINSGGDALVLNVSGLVIETEISAPKIVINTTGDIVQGSNGRFITDALVLTGVGNFELTALNQIGTATTPGLVAIDVEGNVELLNEFAIEFGQIVCGPDLFQGATLTPGAFADGDLTLRTVDSDIIQSGDSVFTVPGVMTFDTGAGNVNLPGFAVEQNDFNLLQVDSGNDVEIFDANGITVGVVMVNNNFMVQAGGLVPAEITLSDVIVVGNQMMLKAGLGVDQQRGFIITDTLLLAGSNDFDLFLNNEINRIGTDITGNLNLQNHVDLTIVKDDYTDLNGLVTSFSGLELNPAFLDGNLNLRTSGDDVRQSADAHVRIADAASFDLGIGELDLSFGDSNGDTINDNDLNVLSIAAAANAEVVDQNSIGIDNTNVSGNLYVESESGSISLQGVVVADNQIMLVALGGAGTRSGALLDTDELLVSGSGVFSLNGENRIGSSAVPGNVALDVDGNVILHNQFGIHFDDLSFTRLGGGVSNLAGANVDDNGAGGHLFVNADGSISDSDTVDILVDGSAAFVAGPGSDVDLGGPNMVTASSVGLGGRKVTLMLDNELVLDGVRVTGDLMVQSTGDISQSGLDVSGLAGSRFVIVNGNANFVVDSISGAVEQRSINLLAVGNDLMNNRLGGGIVIEGTSFLGTGNGELGSVQLRNSTVDTAQFPRLNRTAGDQLTALTVWTPNSSLMITDLGGGVDYDVINNMTLMAGVDSETGQLGGLLKVTDNSKTRSLRDAAGVSIVVGGNFNTNAANTLVLADQATDSIQVGGSLSLVNQGGATENRIRIGVGSGGNRGDDSGANVTADTLRTRANRNGTDGHVTINLDSDVVFTNSNFATSLVVVSGGHITDDATADISVANSAFFEANGGAGDIVLGDDNATNRTIFGSVGFLGDNVSLNEDTALLLNGSDIGGDLDVMAQGSIRQSGQDRFGRAGTAAVEVAGNATFTVDGLTIPGDHLADRAGRDVMLLADSDQNLIDNRFEGTITVRTTQQVSGGRGTLRNVAIRNVALNAATPVFQVTASDPLKNLTLWHPNSSVDLVSQVNAIDYDLAGDLMIVAGLDSANGKLNGNKVIVNNAVVRDITDRNNVSIRVGRSASFYAANHINLVNDASNSLLVGRTATFVSRGGALGNQIDVGTSGPRGNDSGGTFETARLKFTIADTGVGGDLTIVADQPFVLDPSSFAPSVVLSP